MDPATMKIQKLILDQNRNTQGKKRELDTISTLGLVLVWYQSRGACTQSLLVAFGSTSTPLYIWLNFSRRKLLFILSRIPAAQVSFLIDNQNQTYTAAISAKYPILTDVWGAVDGIKLLLQESRNWIVQNVFFKG